MARHDSLREARGWLQQALDLQSRSRPEDSLSLLERGLVEARLHRNTRAVTLLAKNAGLISFHLGNLQRASDYYREAQEHAPRDGHLLFALGDVYKKLGEEKQAAECFSLCRAIAVADHDEDLLELLQTVR